MTTSAIHARNRRALAGIAGLVMAVAGLVVVAPSADAAPAPRTYTAVMTPTTTTPGAPAITYSVVVRNTSTKISALDRFILTIPSGFTVTAGSVATSRVGWTGSVTSTEVKVSTSQPLKYGLLKGQALTMTFRAAYRAGCDTVPVTWVPKADGVIIDPWIYQSGASNTTVTPSPVADRFTITSVTDVDPATLGNQVLKAPEAFSVAGKFQCGTIDAPTSGAGTTLTLNKTGGASLGGNVAVGPSVSTASISGTYPTVENGVGLTIGWTGGMGATSVVDVLGAAATWDGTLGSTLTVPGASTTLTNGANGPVSLVISACDPASLDQAPCSGNTQIELNGDFKGKYTKALPASLVWTCPAADCPHQSPSQSGQEAESSTNYTYNYSCPGNSCDGEGSAFGEREVEEDFAWYPVWVSLKVDGEYGPFQPAGRCVDLPAGPYDENKASLLTHTGTIETSANFCVDVNAITRYAEGTDGSQTFTGTLRIPILFVEDPRVRP